MELVRLDEVFNDILVVILDFIQTCVANDHSQIHVVFQILDDLGKLFAYLQEIEGIRLSEIRSIAKRSLNIIYFVYTASKERSYSIDTNTQRTLDETQAFQRLFENCQDLQTRFIDLMASSKMCYLGSTVHKIEVDMQVISKLLTQLCAIADVIMDLSVRCASQIWTVVLKLVTHMSAHRDVSPDANVWLERAVNVLCAHIKLEMETIFEKSDEHFERVLKIVSFYTKVMFRLACKFDGNYFRGHDWFLDAFQVVLRKVQPSKRLIAVVRNVTKVFTDILAVVAVGEKFLANLWASTDPNRILVSFTLIEILIHDKSNSALSTIYLQNEGRNILRLLAKQLRACSNIQMDQYYNDAVSRCAALMVVQSNDQPEHLGHIERILSDALLTDDFTVGYLALDVWCIWIRFISPVQCLKYLKYWITVSEGLGFGSNRPGSVFVASLIRNLYECVPEDSVLTELSSTSKHMLWLTLAENRLEENAFRLVSNSKASLDNWKMKPSASNWYSLIRNLRPMLDVQSTENTRKEACQTVSGLWPSKLTRSALITPLLHLIITTFTNHTQEHLLFIAAELATLFTGTEKPSVLLRLYCIEFVREIAKIKFNHSPLDTSSIANLCKSLLTDDDAIVRAKCLVAFGQVAPLIVHEEIIVGALRTPALKREVNLFLNHPEVVVAETVDAADTYDLANKSNTFVHCCDHGGKDVVRPNGTAGTTAENKVIWDVIRRVQEDVRYLEQLRSSGRLEIAHQAAIDGIPWKTILNEHKHV